MTNHKFPFEWTLKDAVFTKDKGKVFTTFACGGGSTMGYKLAGYDVIGCNEIDPKLMDAYIHNHNPKYPFLEPIQSFKHRNKLSVVKEIFTEKEIEELGVENLVLPDELFDLDILDGSPPCSSFSMAGNRQEDWGSEKVFREGQALQVLDTLFFDYIDLAAKLQPKICVAENVLGLLMGDAKQYVIKIYRAFDKAGYYLQHFVLDSSKMGVPQKRERVFFVAMRKDLAQPFLVQKDMFNHQPHIDLLFNEKPICFNELADYTGKPITEHNKKAWDYRERTDKNIADSKARTPGMKATNFNTFYVFDDEVCKTLNSKGIHSTILYSKPIYLSREEYIKIGSFPLDYDFRKNGFGYVIGMSVPPLVIANISTRIYEQWLSKINLQK